MKKYDVIVVGAGPTGIFTCYELIEQNPSLNILLVEKGRDIYRRSCPILENKVSKCPHATKKQDIASCYPNCSITNGFGGAGAYSDGKFNITTEFGGWLTDYMSPSQVLELIKYVDEINVSHGAKSQVSDPTTSEVKNIEKRGLAAGLKLLRAKVKHLGTEQNFQILTDIFDNLQTKVDMVFETEVADFITKSNNQQDSSSYEIHGLLTEDNEEYYADKIVIAPGRDGSEWLTKILQRYDQEVSSNQVDIGVRVETLDTIMEEINKNLYEGKFLYRTSVGTTVRSFCNNPSGHVVIENHSGVMLANGHAYKDKNRGSNNTNFALLVSHKFSYPFNKPVEYAKSISKLANDLSEGSVLIQSYGDVMKGRRSTDKRIDECFIEPTLKEAVPGNLGLVLPYSTMISIIEMIEALDVVTPGIASDHTLLYGVEAKFYSSRPLLNNNFETGIKNLYVGGDGAGITRGLAQASACGVAIARDIVKRL
ncbi:NAD(P)/FAD-dependent oxidoreductase [Natranaerobius thermophilus]|uniref:Glucose-inhibited division protein A n=1 Tax=Natranaerobius thermophilus (strain ATCC BAA-1301 / DSM 18059 / JW/NM-WN-LF) TaxID=457570 RepID=B2A6R9_NATTJ|nr:NAD(P)/FAD-dependent oxidoreductase [Natranaerobius thermophilus]ACB84200.1 glucose-inhibited division protein A [Natranaerobius thermophilus JW/NM-WN-LF]